MRLIADLGSAENHCKEITLPISNMSIIRFRRFSAWGTMRRDGNGAAAEVTQAFAVSLALWAAFLITTEATVN
jgi:hypothetical protein